MPRISERGAVKTLTMTAARRRRRSLRSRWKKAAVMMTGVVQLQGEAEMRMGASMITRQEAAETRVRQMYFLLLASTNYLRENIVRS